SLAASTAPMAAASTFLPRALALALRSASAFLRRSHALQPIRLPPAFLPEYPVPVGRERVAIHAQGPWGATLSALPRSHRTASYASISPRWTASASAPTPIAAATSAAPR